MKYSLINKYLKDLKIYKIEHNITLYHYDSRFDRLYLKYDDIIFEVLDKDELANSNYIQANLWDVIYYLAKLKIVNVYKKQPQHIVEYRLDLESDLVENFDFIGWLHIQNNSRILDKL